MPRMDGPRVAERLLKSRPEMGVLYMSGHADKAIRDRASLTPGSALLLKPITPNELLRKVHSILDVCPHS
jgi:CheY-like chemotaxis protein